MTEEEEVEFPVKYVTIAAGINDDGGGLKVELRDDTVPIDKLVDLALRVWYEIQGKEREKREEKDNIYA